MTRVRLQIGSGDGPIFGRNPVTDMHELGIAQSIVETIQTEAATRGGIDVRGIGLRIGAISGVLPDALEFSFMAITAGTPLEGCRFEVEELAAKGRCNACAKQFDVESFLFLCPQCGSGDVKTTQGFEMEIAWLEVDEPEPV